MVANPGGCLMSLRSRGRRGHQTAVTKFSMSWTSEQNSTLWGGSLWRICSRHKTNKCGCTTGVRGCVNSRREIRYLYYFHCCHSSFNPSEAPPWDSRPVSGAGVVHYQLLHRPRSVPTALGPAPLATQPKLERRIKIKKFVCWWISCPSFHAPLQRP